MISVNSLDFLDTTPVIISEQEVPKIGSKKRIKKTIVENNLNTVVRQNLQNSLTTFKERISEFTEQQQNLLIKDWESKRKEFKITQAKHKKELNTMKESLRGNVLEVFTTLFKFKGKAHSITIKSPIDLRYYKFKFSLERN